MLNLLSQLLQNLNLVRLTLLVSIMFTSLAALVLQSPPIIFMAALLLGAPVMSVVVGAFASRHLAVTRVLPEVGTVGDVINGQVVVENRSPWPAFLVQVRSGEVSTVNTQDYRPDPLLDPLLASEGPQPGNSAWNALGLGDAATSALLAPTPGTFYGPLSDAPTRPVLALGGDEHMAPLLHAGTRATWRQHWLLQRRGVYELPPAHAGVVDPLGLYSRLPAQSGPAKIIVLPRPVKLDRLFFFGAATAGLHAPRHAASVTNAMDFHSVREWQPGEAIRRVHWKNTARTGKLHVVEWEEDAAADVTVLLDTQLANVAGTPTDNTLETAITIASSVAAYLLENGYQFQLFYWHQPEEVQKLIGERKASSAQVRRVDARNAKHLSTVLRELAKINPVDDRGATLPQLAQSALREIPVGRSALVVASTRADIEGTLQILSALQHSGGSCHALALDATSFTTDLDDVTLSTGAGASNYTGRNNSSSASHRVVRRGESLAAALDQLL